MLGASLYVGHGAPRLHGIEIYRGRPIFYDLGNFIFQTATEDGFYDAEVWQSIVAECRFDDGRFRDMRLTPLQLNADGVGGPADLANPRTPSIARGAAADVILDRARAIVAAVRHRARTRGRDRDDRRRVTSLPQPRVPAALSAAISARSSQGARAASA